MTGIEGLGEPPDAGGRRTGWPSWRRVIAYDVSSPQAFAVVEDVRDRHARGAGADALVGGGSAFFLDTKEASTRDNLVIIPSILLVVFLILMVLLRAGLAPLILVATVVLSFGAALGISALLFEYVFGFAGSDPSFPLFAFVFLVALGIDYNIFLMTRVREETQHSGTRAGSLVALTTTGGVITSAGLVLAATFLVLGTIPVVFLAELGVAVALGVILDTHGRALGAGHRAQPRPRPDDLVAQQARPPGGCARDRASPGPRRSGRAVTGSRSRRRAAAPPR